MGLVFFGLWTDCTLDLADSLLCFSLGYSPFG